MAQKKFLLIVDHGSRRAEAGDFTQELADRVDAQRPSWNVRVAHLEIQRPDIATGIDNCVAEGASEIIIQPFFLLPGRHTQEDIPAIARAAEERHPDCPIRLDQVIGQDEQIAKILVRRTDALLNKAK